MPIDDIATKRDLDDLLAEKVMGWTLQNGDWYMVFPAIGSSPKFRSHRLWSPSSDAEAAEQVWIRCLTKTRDLGYELCVEVDDEGRIHFNCHHAQLQRLVIIDLNWRMGVCRLALKLNGLDGPKGLPLEMIRNS